MGKSKTKVMLCLLPLIVAIFASIPTALSVTYGPRLDTLYNRFIESPSAQLPMLATAQVDVWPDIRDPVILRQLEEDGFTVVQTQEAFLYYHIDVNVRDQLGNGTHIPLEGGTFADCWRNAEVGEEDYYKYWGGEYEGYVPLDNVYFRHALAHCIPKDEIVATVYGGISAAAIDSLVPEAQRAWYTPGIDGHPLALGDPLATTVWDGNVPGVHHDACSILRAGGFVFDPEAPNPVDKYSPDDPDGGWIDPATGEAMNQMVFAGVTEDIAPDSFGRDDMCYRNWRHIGLAISHPEVDYGYLTDTMMDYYQYDMYALGWSIGRFPDHLVDFFHSRMNRIPEGYNIPGLNNTEMDGYLEIIQSSSDVDAIKQAAADASALLAELCVSIPTVTRPLNLAAGHEDATAFDDSVGGIVNSPGFGADTTDTYASLHWVGNIDPDTNPLGIGGVMSGIIPTEPTNYHPAFASTTDEFLVLATIQEALIAVDPYTHTDIPWLATSWSVEDWDCTYEGEAAVGMNTTFTLREDVDWHDGTHFDAYDCEFALEWLRDMEIGRAQAMWRDLHDVEIHSQYCFSVYHNVSSLWTFYDIAGWAPIIPEHLYAGTDLNYRPEIDPNPLNGNLTCVIGTGPFVITDLDFSLGGYVEQTAYRVNPDLGITTHWWHSAESHALWLETCFHWIGDGNSDGVVDIYDLTKAGKSFALISSDPNYDAEADTAPEPTYQNNDGRVDMRDIIELSKAWGKQRTYA
jgi:ABC-type transport system substrate-binding protein